jgi:hypothetical protein
MEQASAQWNQAKSPCTHLGGQGCALLAAYSPLMIKSFENVDTQAMGLE